MDELKTELQTRKNTSAAGPSDIGYAMLKHLPDILTATLGKLFYICWKTSLVPMQWKWTSLYPIPKPKDWNYNIGITRPILLIECTRKWMMKILTSRLSTCLQEHNILRGPNFAALKGESTSSPIALLNCAIEDAREKNNELWIVCQDMAKAFDSVGLTPLKFALQCIKLPPNIIEFIIHIFKERKIKIITTYGLSNGFTAEDGIDQGEIISPLLWRIFYDPLLCRIQSNPNYGYTMHWHNNTILRPIRIACSAFADDTIWVGASREQTQAIIETSNSFFALNDIEINGNKSELLVINGKQPIDRLKVIMGKNKDVVTCAGLNTPVRFLGVWLSRKKGSRHTINICAHYIKDTVSTLKPKAITLAHAVYIVNTVIIPKVLYMLQSTELTSSTANTLQSPLNVITKIKGNFPITMDSSALHHQALVGLNILSHKHLENSASIFVDLISKNTVTCRTLLNRICLWQLIHGLTIPPFDVDLDITSLGHTNSNNWAIYILRELRLIDISIMLPNNLNVFYNSISISPTINSVARNNRPASGNLNINR